MLRALPGREDVPVLIVTSYHHGELRHLPRAAREVVCSKDSGLTPLLEGLLRVTTPSPTGAY